jgi:polysaccharide export outer membrane protein
MEYKFYKSLLIVLTVTSILFLSCKIYSPTYYFKDINRDTIISGFVNNELELKIQNNDQLAISIASLSLIEDALFNSREVEGASKNNFQVSQEGFIYMHKLGKVKVVGLTRKELKILLENELLPYLKDPIVTINFNNHRVTVLGEGSSQVIEIPSEKIPLLEVMAKAGGGLPNAQLNNVMIIRESQNIKQVKHLNLENSSILTSPWYFLQPNDIVVIKPNELKSNSEQRTNNSRLIYTTVLSSITFVFLIIDRISR